MTPPRDQQSELYRLIEEWRASEVHAAAIRLGLRESEQEAADDRAAAAIATLRIYWDNFRKTPALTAHDEALPGDWTYEPHPELAFFCINDGNDCLVANVHSEEEAALIVAAHNSALRFLVDAQTKMRAEMKAMNERWDAISKVLEVKADEDYDRAPIEHAKALKLELITKSVTKPIDVKSFYAH